MHRWHSNTNTSNVWFIQIVMCYFFIVIVFSPMKLIFNSQAISSCFNPAQQRAQSHHAGSDTETVHAAAYAL